MSMERRDLIVATALVVVASVYVAAWPRDFGGLDEGMYLYEAKRILDGDVMYRDFFQILTPAWFYLMAGCYALFGMSLETARATVVVVHAVIVAMIFAIGRRVGVPATLAVLLAILHLTLGFPASTIATPHWFSTLLYLIIAAIILRSPCVTPRRAAGWGVLIGLLILVQQQKGAIMALGVGLVLVVDWRMHTRSLRGAGAGAIAYVCAIAAVVAPVMLIFVALAGFDDVWKALVLYPFRHYPRIHENIQWGFYVPGTVPFGFIIPHLPAIIPLGAAVAFWRREHANRRPVIVLLILSFFALLSVIYNRNYFHLALAAPLWFLLGAALLASGADRSWAARPSTRWTIAVMALLLIVLCLGQLVATLQTRRAAVPYAAVTAFGWIAMWSADEPEVVQQLSALLHDQRGAEVFVYPANPGLYLITGLRNPTRYQIVLPGYTAQAELDEIIDTLEQRRVEFVVHHAYPGIGLNSLNAYVSSQYALVANLGGNVVYRRKAPAPSRPAL
jgi:hypothetical protein